MELQATFKHDWELVCRESFNLSPTQLATLCAIIKYCEHHDGKPMPVSALHRLRGTDGIYRVSASSAPSELFRFGLIDRLKVAGELSFVPTKRGLRRVRQ